MTLNALVEQLIAEIDYRQNPYFVALRNGEFERDDFIETQIQFFMAVIFFSRPMAAVAARIPGASRRLEVIRNVWEEHGEGQAHLMHGTTFEQFLARLGITDRADIERRGLWPEVRQFNTTLSGACVLDEFLIGVSVMGMIEYMFSDISGMIGRAVVARGWISEAELVHYDLHEQLDIKHAQDFFNVAMPSWEGGSEDDRYIIEQGLRLGAHAFNSMYLGLYHARKRRLFRTARCPHART